MKPIKVTRIYRCPGTIVDATCWQLTPGIEDVIKGRLSVKLNPVFAITGILTDRIVTDKLKLGKLVKIPF